MRRLVLLIASLVTSTSFAQSPQEPIAHDIETLNSWVTAFQSGVINYRSADSLISSLSSDYDTTFSFKRYQRIRALWDSRVGNSDTSVDFSSFSKALQEYLDTSYCGSDMAEWENIGPNGTQMTGHYAGYVSAIKVFPDNENEILIGSPGGGIYKSNDGGQTWNCMTCDDLIPIFGVSAIAIKPDNPNIVIASTGSKVYNRFSGVGMVYSTDRGQSWVRIDAPYEEIGPMVVNVQFHPNQPNKVVAIGRHVLYRSLDGGVNWDTTHLTGYDMTQAKYFNKCTFFDDNNVLLTVSNRWDSYFSDIINVQPWNNGAASLLTDTVVSFLEANYDIPSMLWQIADSSYSWDTDGGWLLIDSWVSNGQLFLPYSSSMFNPSQGRIRANLVSARMDSVRIWIGGRQNATIRMSVVVRDSSGTQSYVNLDRQVPTVDSILTFSLPPAGFDTTSAVYNFIEFKTLDDSLTLDSLHIYGFEQLSETSLEAQAFSVSHVVGDKVVIGVKSIMNAPGGMIHFLDYTPDTLGMYSLSYRANTIQIPLDRIGNNTFTIAIPDTTNSSPIHVGYVEKSIVYGFDSTVTAPHLHDDHRSVDIVNTTSGDYLLWGTDGGPEKQLLSDNSMTSLRGDLASSLLHSIAIPESLDEKVLCGLQDNQHRMLDVDNVTFDNYGWGDGNAVGFDPLDPGSFFGVDGQQGGSVKIDEGYPGLNSVNGTGFYLGGKAAFSETTPGTVYFGVKAKKNGDGTQSNRVIKYTRSTASATAKVIETYSGDLNGVGAIVCAPLDEDIVFAGGGMDGDRKLYKSTDGGDNWTNLDNSSLGNGTFQSEISWNTVTDIEVGYDPNNVWVSIGNFEQDSSGNAIAGYNRVLRSEDGGQSWEDWSTGLPALPAMRIEHYRGSDGLVFCATDGGIFYRKNGMAQWECFNEGIPYCLTTELRIKYCTNELYLATYGHSVYKTPIPAELLEVGGYTLASNETWDSKRMLNGNLIIPANTTLTIEDTVFVAADARIDVMPGGLLKVDGGLLTNRCGQTWEGIRVWGQDSVAQIDANQGKAWVLNGGTIEHAETALTTRVLNDQTGQIDWAKSGGGIIQLNGAVLRDNRVGILHYPYVHMHQVTGQELANVSFVTDSEFEWTDNYPAEFDEPLAHIVNAQVMDADVNGSDFRNLNTQQHEGKGVGIYAFDSKFDIGARCAVSGGAGQPCQTLDSSRFEGLDAGVIAAGWYGNAKMTLKESVFSNNTVGVALQGADFSEVFHNRFEVANGGITPGGQFTPDQGVAITGTGGVQVEGNEFVSTSSFAFSNNVAVYSQNSNVIGTASEVYDNHMEDNTIGVQTDGGNTQLNIDCNQIDYSGTQNAHAGIHHYKGYLKDQGQCHPADAELPQANEFTSSCTSSNYNWQVYRESVAQSFEYNTYGASAGVDGTCFDPGVLFTNCEQSSQVPGPLSVVRASACPTNYPATFISDPYSGLSTFKPGYYKHVDAEDSLTQLIDGGDASALITSINDGEESDEDVHNLLMSHAPYLSEEVLIALVQSSRDEWVKEEALDAHYPVSDNVVEAILDEALAAEIVNDAFKAGMPVRTDLLTELFSTYTKEWVIEEVAIKHTPMTDEEMLALLDHSTPLSDSAVYNIFSINTPLSETVETALDERDPEVSSWVLSDIKNSTVVAGDPALRMKTTSAYDELISEIAYHHNQRLLDLNAMVRIYLDTNMVDSAAYYLENDGSLEAEIALIPILMEQDTSKASTHITSVRSMADTIEAADSTSTLPDELRAFCDFQDAMKSIAGRGSNVFQLYSEELLSIEDMADATTPVSIRAQSVVDLSGQEYSYPAAHELLFPGSRSASATIPATQDEEERVDQPLMVDFPDPNNGITTIRGSLPLGTESAMLVVRDVTGRTIRVKRISEESFEIVLDLSTHQNGVYFYSLQANGVILETNRMMISR